MHPAPTPPSHAHKQPSSSSPRQPGGQPAQATKLGRGSFGQTRASPADPARPARSACAAQDLFDLGSVKELFAIKCQDSFVAFECGEITEAEHFATYFTDRRPVDGSRVTEYLRSRYEWLPGMRELCTELQGAGVPMAAMSNYPAPWAPLIEDAVNLSQLVPWAFVSGEVGLRKPSPEAYTAALEAVGRRADQVIFVDDNPANVDAARALGIEAIRFESAAALRPELQRAGVLPR